jgi:nitrogen fixation protein NifB
MPLDIHRHPCFSDTARHRFARIHLPVAPDCNLQCNFCKRKYDCANESRPGVTSAVLTPGQALHYLDKVIQRDPRISVVGIAGPGDPFATPDRTLETLRLVRERYPEMLLCVASNGLNVAPYVAELAELGLSHLTITVNAVDPAIGAQIYAWVRDGKRMLRGLEAGRRVWERQAAAIQAAKDRGLTVKINTIIVPGVNDGHVVEVARRTAELGADIANCVPLYPVPDTPFGTIESPSSQAVASLRSEVTKHLPVMQHCARCRADAVGLLGEPMRPEIELCLLQSASLPLNPSEERSYVAVASLEGVLVNQHLGEAEQFSIFAKESDGFRLVESRTAPSPGGGPNRWLTLAKILHDCRALLVSGAGNTPREVLTGQGVQVVVMEGLIEEGLDAIFRGASVRAPLRAEHRCGVGCAGDGRGCL